jgi:hypothetical protein
MINQIGLLQSQYKYYMVILDTKDIIQSPMHTRLYVLLYVKGILQNNILKDQPELMNITYLPIESIINSRTILVVFIIILYKYYVRKDLQSGLLIGWYSDSIELFSSF